MMLEDEALKAGRGAPRPARRPPTGFDWLARGLAMLILLAGLSAIYWIPFQLVGTIGAAFVLAALTLLAANLASRLHKLRQRVDELEARLDERTPPQPPQP